MVDDFFLNVLVSWARAGIGFGVTLCIGGAVIAGDLISEEEYFASISQSLREGASSGSEEEVREKLGDLLSNLPHLADEAAMRHLDEGADPEEVQHIREKFAEACVHLKNTQVMAPDGTFVDWHGFFWRGRKSAIDGFWLGRKSG